MDPPPSFKRPGALATNLAIVLLCAIWGSTWVVIRSGLSHDVGGVDLQVGLEIRSYAYQLEQVNHVERTYREQDESWIEWSPTFGALFRFDALDLRYSGRVTTGTGRPGVGDVARTSGPGEQLLGDGDFILAPDGPLTLHGDTWAGGADGDAAQAFATNLFKQLVSAEVLRLERPGVE